MVANGCSEGALHARRAGCEETYMRLKHVFVLAPMLWFAAMAVAADTQLKEISVTAQGGATAVTLETAGPFTHSEYRPQPTMVLVDLQKVSSTALKQRQRTLDSPVVKSYRVLEYKSVGGVEVTRVELTVTEVTKLQVKETKNGLQLLFATGDFSAAEVKPPAAPAPQMKPAATPKPANLKPPKPAAGAPAQAAARGETPAVPPITIHSVEVLRTSAGVAVGIEGAKTAKTLVLSNPERLVLDIENAILANKQTIAVDTADLKSVRVAQFQAAPPITRVVLDLAGPREFDLANIGNKLVVTVLPPKAAAAPPTPPAPVIAPAPQVEAPAPPTQTPSKEVAQLFPQPEEKDSKAVLHPAGKAFSDQTIVDGEKSPAPPQPDASAAGQAPKNEPQPPSPVNEKAAVDTPAKPANEKAAADTPASPANEKAAVDTPAKPANEKAAADTPAKPANEKAAADTPANPANEKAAADTPANPANEKAAADAAPVQKVETPAPQPATVVQSNAPAETPAKLVPAKLNDEQKPDATPKSADYVYVSPEFKKQDSPSVLGSVDPASSRAVEAAATIAQNQPPVLNQQTPTPSPQPEPPKQEPAANDQLQPQKPEPAANLALEQKKANANPPPPPPVKKYTGEPISVNLKDVDIKDFFRLIHEISGLNIVLDPNVKGSLTLVLDDVPWDQALDVVLRNNGLGRELEGNILRIAALDTFRKEAEEQRARTDAQALAVNKITVTRFLSYGRAKDVMPTIKRLLSSRGEVLADDRTNALIINDIPSNIPGLDRLITQLDRKTMQVEIEARVVSATRNFAQQLGTQLGFAFGNGNTSIGGNPSNGYSTQTYTSSSGSFPYFTNSGSIPLFSNLGQTSSTSGLAFSTAVGNYRVDVLLSAAESRGLAKVLSRPRVVTQNNVTAVVRQGYQIPIVTQSQLGGPATTTYINAFLRLTVTPQITIENTIFLAVDVENTTPDFGNSSTTVGGNPSLLTQQATTQVLVSDGGTVVIGGVIQTSSSINTSQVPWLGNIPVLGNLFKSRSVSTSTQELIFIICPKIVQT